MKQENSILCKRGSVIFKKFLRKSVMRSFDIHKKNLVQLKKTFQYKREVVVFPLHLKKTRECTNCHAQKQTNKNKQPLHLGQTHCPVNLYEFKYFNFHFPYS